MVFNGGPRIMQALRTRRLEWEYRVWKHFSIPSLTSIKIRSFITHKIVIFMWNHPAVITSAWLYNSIITSTLNWRISFVDAINMLRHIIDLKWTRPKSRNEKVIDLIFWTWCCDMATAKYLVLSTIVINLKLRRFFTARGHTKENQFIGFFDTTVTPSGRQISNYQTCWSENVRINSLCRFEDTDELSATIMKWKCGEKCVLVVIQFPRFNDHSLNTLARKIARLELLHVSIYVQLQVE